MADHSGDGQPSVRGLTVVILSIAKVWVGQNSVASDCVEGDGLGGQAAAAGGADDGMEMLGVSGRPLEDLHSAHRAADDGQNLLYAEVFQEEFLDADHIADCDDGELQSIGLSGSRIDGGRSCGSSAAAEHIGANDKIAGGVDGFARADHPIPPARFAVVRAVIAGGVGVSAEGMAKENDVVFVGGEGSIGFISDVNGA